MLSLTPNTVDSSTGPHTIDVTLRATDDLSGIGFVVSNLSPNGIAYNGGAFTLTSGTNTDGEYHGTIQIPQFAPSGNYQLQIVIGDNVQHVTSENPSGQTVQVM